MSEFLPCFVTDFARAMHVVDRARPIAMRSGEKGAFRAGIGPHSEDVVVELCLQQMVQAAPQRYGRSGRSIAYPDGSRSRCDLCFGEAPDWDWAIEVKLLRFLGDNGKQNGNMLMHILSPYPQDRSALTDCSKLAAAPIATHKAIVIFGYEHQEWPLEPAIAAFETLAVGRVELGDRHTAETGPLVHPVHDSGRVFGWEILADMSGPAADRRKAQGA